jgi:hypothetical protein
MFLRILINLGSGSGNGDKITYFGEEFPNLGKSLLQIFHHTLEDYLYWCLDNSHSLSNGG